MKKPTSLITLSLIFGLIFGLVTFLLCLPITGDSVFAVKLSLITGASLALLMHISISFALSNEKKKYDKVEKSFGKKFICKISGIFVFRKICSGMVYVFEDGIFIASLDCRPEILLKITAKEILGCRSNGSAVTIFADKGNILFKTPEADRLMREIHKIRNFIFNT